MTSPPHNDQAADGEGRYGVNAIPQDQLKDRIGALQGRIDDLMSNLQQDQAKLGEQLQRAQQVVGTATRADGEITASVTAYGEVTELTVTDKALRTLGADRLSAAVKEALNEARTDAVGQSNQVAGEEALQVAADPVGSMLDRLPEVTETLPPEMVAKLRAGGAQA